MITEYPDAEELCSILSQPDGLIDAVTLGLISPQQYIVLLNNFVSQKQLVFDW
jgi:hypothetical protein